MHSPNPTRVASRFHEAARPIKINRGSVQAVSETLVRDLGKWAQKNREPFEPLGVETRRPLAT